MTCHPCLDALLYTVVTLPDFFLFLSSASPPQSSLSASSSEELDPLPLLAVLFSAAILEQRSHAHLLLPVRSSGAVNWVRQEYTEHSQARLLYLQVGHLGFVNSV